MELPQTQEPQPSTSHNVGIEQFCEITEIARAAVDFSLTQKPPVDARYNLGIEEGRIQGEVLLHPSTPDAYKSQLQAIGGINVRSAVVVKPVPLAATVSA